jgi:ferrochelatase
VAPERVEEVAHHYDLFGGVSPLTALTTRQAALLAERLRDLGQPLPVYLGMRNWHPYLQDTLAQMAKDGVRRAVGFIAAAQRSYSSCTQYRENVDAARASLAAAGLPGVEVTYVGDWHTHAGFVDANAGHIADALTALPDDVRGSARIVFTAHSIPLPMAERSLYRRHLEESCAAIAERLGTTDFALVYQSRSGRPEDPWLGPDIRDYLREERAKGLAAVVVSPVGFLCDHIEVLYDLDFEAADVCREIGLPMARASAVNDDARFVDTMAASVMQILRRYDHARPLPIVSVAS